MKCPKCSFENLDGSIYCINCGLRLDGNVTCPNCRNTIPAISSFCPKCGKKIPHSKHVEADVKPNDEKIKRIKDRASRITKIVFTAVTMALLIYAMFACFSNIIIPDLSSTSYLINNGSLSFYLWGQWAHMYDSLKDINDVAIIIGTILNGVITFVASSSVVVVTFLFGVKSIVIGVRELRKKGGCEYKNGKCLISVFATYLASFAIITSFSPRYQNNFVMSFSYLAFVFLSFFFFILQIIASCILKYDANKKAMFVQKVLFINCFVFLFIMVLNLGNDCIGGNIPHPLNDVGASYYLIDSIVTFSSIISLPEPQMAIRIASFSLSIAQYIFFIFLVVTSSSLIGYFLSGFLSDSEPRMGFKLPFYVVSTAQFIGSIVYLSFVIVSCVLQFYLTDGAYDFLAGVSPLTAFIFASLVFGFSMACFIIVRKSRHKERLIARNQL